MDFAFTEEQEMLRDTVRKLIARVATPEYCRETIKSKAFPQKFYDALIEAGLMAIPYPEEFGGVGGSLVDVAIVMEEINKPSSDLPMMFGGAMFCGLNVLRMGTQEQKQKWLPKLISGEIKLSIGLSEPDAGSDLGAIRTSAVLDGDQWVINGLKTWQSGAGVPGNVISLYVKTDSQAHYRNGMSLILVPNDASGVTCRKLDLLGHYCTGTYEVTFDNVRVPREHLIGNINKGWDCLLSGVTEERAVVAASDVGAAIGVLDMTIEYARERKQFGRPIGNNQAIAHMLADMKTEVSAARALMWNAVWAAENKADGALELVTMAKLFAAEAYVKVANQAMQIFGGNGYSTEYPIERHYRDSRIHTVAAGSSQMLRNLVAGLNGLKVA
jgi:alkylation response protein AidB-like acyl-CoA dehydrogenase